MNQKAITACFVLLFMVAGAIYSETDAQGSDTVRYLYHPKWEKVLKKEPADGQRWQKFELFSRNYTVYADPEEKVLPLVFNILDVAGKNKIKKEDVTDQVEVLNDAFAGRLQKEVIPLFKPVLAGDSRIRFCLGLPDGKTEGVYSKTVSKGFSKEAIGTVSTATGLVGVDRTQYINIWITELEDSLGGFAILPGHDEQLDGIYIDPDFFGKKKEGGKYQSGKTLVHLMGIYLGLKPLWTNLDCSDDGVEDTPIHNAPNNKCYRFSHTSTCSGREEEMVGNFMDSNPDDCASYFTKGQAMRMHATLSAKGYRSDLLKGNKACKVAKSQLPAEQAPILQVSEKQFLQVSVFPNPASGAFQVKFSNAQLEQVVNIDILNSLGQSIRSYEIPALGEPNGQLTVETAGWQPGLYVLKIRVHDQEESTSFIVTK